MRLIYNSDRLDFGFAPDSPYALGIRVSPEKERSFRENVMTGSEIMPVFFPYITIGLFLLGDGMAICTWLSLPAHVKWTLLPCTGRNGGAS